jgi:hypothetical protein
MSMESKMKRSILTLAAALMLGACSNDVTAPVELDEVFDEIAVLAYDAAGMSGPGHYLTGLHRLPAELRLTREQAEAVKVALGDFHTAVKPHREALAAIHAEARAAREAGKSREEVGQILAKAGPILQAVAAAEAVLLAKIESILTPAQKAWLDAHQPVRCNRTTDPLTDVQRSEVGSLIAAYEEANKADLEAIKAALDAARAAIARGAPRAEVNAILASIKPARERVAAAQAALHEAIQALLTDAQKASGCFRGTLIIRKSR